MNVDFAIHRYAEWTMLMLGESILSLLIVDVEHEDTNYFATFYCGLLTVIFLQYLHFRSMPHAADDHAMRRSKNRGVAWILCKYTYSCALVALGAAFALFLLSFTYEIVADDDHRSRRAAMMNMMMLGGVEDEPNGRLLAGGGSSTVTLDEFMRMQQSAAHLYTGALSVVFFGLDGMTFFTVGLEGCKARCRCPRTFQYNVPGILLIISRVMLLVFTSTFSQWTTDPQVLAGAGLGVTICQIITRKLGMRYLNKKLEQVAAEDGGPDGVGVRSALHHHASTTQFDDAGHDDHH
jgi:hypothetical protein